MLLPFVLISGGYWYVTGGQVMSSDDAYVEADKVGVSTDVSGIVKDVDVTENQHVDSGQVLYHLDDLPFRIALDRADAQVGMVRDTLNSLKANYRDMQTQITQARYDIDYYATEFHRQQDLLNAHSGNWIGLHSNVSHCRCKAAARMEKLRAFRECVSSPWSANFGT
jgi:membrane fusion protein (multidrug efflux system)